MRDQTHHWIERQLTTDPSGHTLNRRQAISADGRFAAFDSRNDDSRIGSTSNIGLIDLNDGNIHWLYSAPNSTEFGPGVGAVACHPTANRVVFIHGLNNCNSQRPYAMTRRFGAMIDWSHDSDMVIKRHSVIPAESRSLAATWQPGTLRGGTHAHSWSGDGQCLSFTYNDAIVAAEATNQSTVRDLRTVGVMMPQEAPNVSPQSEENFTGSFYSALIAPVSDNPTPGSDEIETANEECWIGTNGYSRPDGSQQRYAIAYQGIVRDDRNQTMNEVFVVDLPEWSRIKQSLSREVQFMKQNTSPQRLPIPSILRPRRLTYSHDMAFPGIQGPRNWLVTTPDGARILFPMRDEQGIVQVASVPTIGGSVQFVSDLEHSIEGQITVSRDGKKALVCSARCVVSIDIETGIATILTKPATSNLDPSTAIGTVEGAIHETHDGCYVYNRYVENSIGRHLQIFKLARA